MTECQNCNSKLITDGLNPGQQFRCANCLTFSTFGEVQSVDTHRLAWRSFWLGLSSILLLFITGLPAIYYGIRSLLRMRFVKANKSDRVAAITGTALGGCFGVLLGFMVICGLVVGLIAFLTYESSTEEKEVVKKCGEVFDFTIPTGLKPIQATSLFQSLRSFQFADHEEPAERSILIVLENHGASLQTNRERFLKELITKRVNVRRLGKVQESEILDWKMNGQPIDVRKTVYKREYKPESDADPDADSEPDPSDVQPVETHQYVGYFQRSDGYYGMVVVFEPGKFETTESMVESVFAMTSLVEK